MKLTKIFSLALLLSALDSAAREKGFFTNPVIGEELADPTVIYFGNERP